MCFAGRLWRGFAPTGAAPWALTIEPAGQYFYLSSGRTMAGTGGVVAFALDTSTGAPKIVAGSPFPAGTATGIATDPLGKFVFVTDYYGDNVSVFVIDRNTGAPTPAPGSAFATGSTPYGVAATMVYERIAWG